jgi:hypothetical protein
MKQHYRIKVTMTIEAWDDVLVDAASWEDASLKAVAAARFSWDRAEVSSAGTSESEQERPLLIVEGDPSYEVAKAGSLQAMESMFLSRNYLTSVHEA